MRCPVCGSQNDSKPTGTSYWSACADSDCQLLLWEAHLSQDARAPGPEQDVLAWQWRRQRAAAQGMAFREPWPTSPAERAIAVLDVIAPDQKRNT